MSKGKPITREEALQLVPRIEKMLRPWTKRVMVCGSVRRGVKDVVNDIDVVVIPVDGEKIVRKSISMDLEGVQVDVNVTTEEAWGASILMWTGTKELNVKMRSEAKARGWKISQYGLFDRETGKKLAGRTEEEMFEALGLEYLAPAEREIGWNDELKRLGE